MIHYSKIKMEYISLVYYPYACLICLEAKADIKRCSNCKIACYCSTNHQKLDWRRSHKDLCKAISACDKKFAQSIHNFEQWTDYRIGRQEICRNLLNRELSMQELIMNQFSPRCAVCYTKDNLYCCKTCFNISYCSNEHELQYISEHKRNCDKFKLSLMTEQFVNAKGQPDVQFNPIDKEQLTCTNDILKYIKLINFSFGHSFLTREEEISVLDIIKTERVVLGLNLLHALQFVNFSNEKLNIHIVGASNLEEATNWSVATEILLNWTNYSYVTYHLIGPDLDQNTANIKRNKYQVIYHSCLYHLIIDKIDKPDLVAAFNCGLHEFENDKLGTWSSSIPTLLFYKGVPLVLTSFTEDELITDKDILLRVKCPVNILQDVNTNPFSFLKPLRDWASRDMPIFYRCNYIFIAEKGE